MTPFFRLPVGWEPEVRFATGIAIAAPETADAPDESAFRGRILPSTEILEWQTRVETELRRLEAPCNQSFS